MNNIESSKTTSFERHPAYLTLNIDLALAYVNVNAAHNAERRIKAQLCEAAKSAQRK